MSKHILEGMMLGKRLKTESIWSRYGCCKSTGSLCYYAVDGVCSLPLERSCPAAQKVNILPGSVWINGVEVSIGPGDFIPAKRYRVIYAGLFGVNVVTDPETLTDAEKTAEARCKFYNTEAFVVEVLGSYRTSTAEWHPVEGESNSDVKGAK